MEKMEAPIDPNEEAEDLLTQLSDGIERAKVKGVPVEELDSVLQALLEITSTSTLEERIRAINRIQGDKEALINLRGLLVKLAPDMIVEDEIELAEKRRMPLPLHDAIFTVYDEGGSIVIGGKNLSCKKAIRIALSGNGEVRELRLLSHVQLQSPVSIRMPDEEVLREVYMSEETE